MNKKHIINVDQNFILALRFGKKTFEFKNKDLMININDRILFREFSNENLFKEFNEICFTGTEIEVTVKEVIRNYFDENKKLISVIEIEGVKE